MKKHIVILIAVILLASILRFWMLGQIPSSMSDDEVRLTYTAYSIWNTGKDVNGHLFPLAFVIDRYGFNPVAIYFTSPFVGILGLNMFTARLPFAIIGVLTIFLLYLTTDRLFKNKYLAIFSSLALTFSVWHLQLSRFAYEGQFALFFYLLGIYLFLLSKKNNFIVVLLSMLSFFFAFHSYSGTKLILVPIIIALIWYKFKELTKKQIAFVALAVFVTFFSFFLLSKFQNASSYGSMQFFFQDKATVAEAVELERRASFAPTFLNQLYHNKLTYWSKIFVNHYSYAFSPQYLFISQEGSGIFSIWQRGQMYIIEVPLLFLGALYLFHKKRREFVLILLFLFIAPLPSGLGAEPTTYTIRSSFMLPWLMIFVGAGIYAIFYFVKKVKLRVVIYLLLLVIYAYLIGGYLNQYYFDWMAYGSKYYSKGTKDLVYLLNKEKQNFNQVLVVGAIDNIFLHFAFYNRLNPKLVQADLKQNPIKIDNITFSQKCLNNGLGNPADFIKNKTLFISNTSCYKYTRPNYTIISSDKTESYWKIYKK